MAELRCVIASALLLVACWVAVGLQAAPATAHELATAKLSFVDEGARGYRLTATVGPAAVVDVPDLGEACEIADAARRSAPGSRQIHEWLIDCDDAASTTDAAIGLALGVDDALVVTRNRDGIEHTFQLSGRDGRIILPIGASFAAGQGRLDLAWRQIELGIAHILSGVDHLALLVCLCLVASGWGLVQLVTGFTIGHSLTLALATLGWVTVPGQLIEAWIALSIVFFARQAYLGGEKAHGFWLVVGFGLLHGLGFAGALAELSLPQNDLLTALLAFNIGVEIGQLVLVTFVVALLHALRSLRVSVPSLVRCAAFGLGSLAVFWTLERVIAFGV